MSTHVFVTTELAPLTPGGAGRLVADLASSISQAGHDVHVVLVTSDDVASDHSNIHVVHSVLAEDGAVDFMAQSIVAADALAALRAEISIDRIEIQDFDGLAFWTLAHRSELDLSSVTISVRFHGPVDIQAEAIGAVSPSFALAAAMERASFVMADATIVPSVGIRDLVVDRYALEPRRILIGSPIIRRLESDPSKRAPSQHNPSFVVIGRLSEVKGSHDMVVASIPMLRAFPDAVVTFVGADGWSATENSSMSAWLRNLIPDDVSDQFVFKGPVGEAELGRIVGASTAVVAPSRFESFNLAVREARRIGAAVVVPDIAAFRDFSSGETGAFVYDGSIGGLTESLTMLASDSDLVAKLSRQPEPPMGDPMHVYEVDLPEVRHVRSQHGLATAALAEIEQVQSTYNTDDARAERVHGAIRRLPRPLFRFARMIVPASVRRRVRQMGDWDAGLARQETLDRWAAVHERVDVGRLDLIPSPEVTVVIPCYNQGAFVRDAVLSVFEQTADSYEIVIVDDGSDDPETLRVLDSLVYPRLSVLHQDNSGLSGARNAGIRVARGKYVVTLDADDELCPLYIESLSAELDRNRPAAFAHCWAELYGDVHAMWATRPHNRYQLLVSNSVVGCVMLRRSAWLDVGGYDETMRDGNEDWDLWIRLSEAGYDAVQVREPLFRYRKHGVSMSVGTESRHEAALDEMVKRLPEVYSPQSLAEKKRAEYPLLTVLTDESSVQRPFDDSEVIVTDREHLRSALDDSHGKFVVWWPAEAMGSEPFLGEMCSLLERHDDLGSVETSSDLPIRVVRRWSLHDPDAPSRSTTTEFGGTSTDSLKCGQFPDSQWQVPSHIHGVPVRRQRPEEAGYLLTWMLA